MTKPVEQFIQEGLHQELHYSREEEVDRLKSILYAFIDDVEQLVKTQVKTTRKKHEWLILTALARKTVTELAEIIMEDENNG